MAKKTPLEKSLDYTAKTWDRKWQSVWKIKVATLISRLEREETVELDYDLSAIDLSNEGIQCKDLYEVIEHYKLVKKANLKYPILLWHKWEVLDGRHRICKAIIEGRKTIKAIMFIRDQGARE